MRHATRLMGSSAILALTLATPLRAEVQPIAVWDGFKGFMEDLGYTVEGELDSAQVGSGALDVRNVVMRVDLEEDEGTLAFEMGTLELRAQEGGEVLARLPDGVPIRFSGSDSGEEEVDMVVTLGTETLEFFIASEGNTTTVSYMAPEVTASLVELVVDGMTVPREDARARLSLLGMSGETTVVTDGGRQITQTFGAAEAQYDIAFTDPDTDDRGMFTGSMEQFLLENDSTLPEGYDAEAMTDMAALVEMGLAGVGAVTYVDGQTEFSVSEDSGVTSGQMSTDTARMSYGIGPDGLSYGIGNTGFALAVTSPDMPFPVSAAMAETAFDMKMPVLASEAPQDVALGVTLGGFTMSEMLWGMFDPGAVLPRDPATVSFDLLGKVTPFVSLFDSEAMEAAGSGQQMPGELNAVTLSNLVVEAAGARLTGIGDFTFDNTDLDTFDGFPRPEGEVDLQLSGANGLIDALISMGIVTQEDAMGARMMMTMFAVPAGDDLMTSTIRVNEQGHVLANGQRIR